MRYQGGKSKIAKDIARAINYDLLKREISPHNGGVFVSLFCGSCAVESELTNFSKRICNDNHYYLIEMFKGLQRGYEFPDSITEEQYQYIKEHKDEDKVLTGFVGFSCSFGGEWFGTYARAYKEDRNYCKEGKMSLQRQIKSVKDINFLNKDYKDVELPKGSIIYADPPYDKTHQYTTGEFNSNEFWKYARKVSESHIMYISEQTAPNDFIPIWQTSYTRTMNYQENKCTRPIATEKLFIHKDNIVDKPIFGEQLTLF